MVAGAYGLEEDNVVIVDTLQSENLDFNEFQASLDAIAMAVREHYEEIKELINERRRRPRSDRNELHRAICPRELAADTDGRIAA